ncbi:hypothetical protein GCM10023238_27150 [Streptomyces heliomycini]
MGAARLVCGRRSKWLVLGLWVVVLFAVAPFAQKLGDAQTTTRRPGCGSAVSTQVLEISEGFRPEQIPRSWSTREAAGWTAADRERIAEDVARLERLGDHGIRGGETLGPVFDRRPTRGPRRSSCRSRWTPGAGSGSAPRSTRSGARSARAAGASPCTITGPGGTSADLSEAFAGIDSTLLLSATAVVVVMLLIT